MVVHAFNSSTWEADRSQAKLKASLVYKESAKTRETLSQ